MNIVIEILLNDHAGGSAWSIDVDEHRVASGWHLSEHEAKVEALDVGIESAVRWLNPRGVTPADREG